jgi:hypothetical protein
VRSTRLAARPVQIVLGTVDNQRPATSWAAAPADRGYRLPTGPFCAQEPAGRVSR